jgi:uncharacterized protein (TIGR00299 family) protein
MTRTAYFDCFSGCSGDMIIGSLIDAGLDFQMLKNVLSGFHLPGYHITMEKVKRASITATKFNVVLESGHQDSQGHDNTHEHKAPNRGLSDILNIINTAVLSDSVKRKSTEIFRKLGTVEAGIHGVPLEDVHFHELGAIDTIVDIVGTLLGLEVLKIERVCSSPLVTGSGTVRTAHGILPVPAPATLQILTEAGAPLAKDPASDIPPGELLTPTGAVLITSLAATYHRPDIKPEKIGYGAGNKEFPGWPNVVRVLIGEESEKTADDNLVLLETNIDDMNPQIYGYIMERLFERGVADVWFTPIQMKKNRPAVMFSVLCAAEREEEFTGIIMRETTTLGVRSRPVNRHVARRTVETIETTLGKVPVKIKRFKDILSITPEYEDCRRIARETGLSLQQVIKTVDTEARRYLENQNSTQPFP